MSRCLLLHHACPEAEVYTGFRVPLRGAVNFWGFSALFRGGPPLRKTEMKNQVKAVNLGSSSGPFTLPAGGQAPVR